MKACVEESGRRRISGLVRFRSDFGPDLVCLKGYFWFRIGLVLVWFGFLRFSGSGSGSGKWVNGFTSSGYRVVGSSSGSGERVVDSNCMGLTSPLGSKDLSPILNLNPINFDPVPLNRRLLLNRKTNPTRTPMTRVTPQMRNSN